MFIPTVCKDYGWTYQEYMNQPTWFIELIRQKMVIDVKAHEQAMKKVRGK